MNLQLPCTCVIPRSPKEEHNAVFGDDRHTYLPTMLRNEFIDTEVSPVFRITVDINAIT